MNWASLFETLMIVCFGLSWPLSIVRTLRTKSTKGKSPFFMAFIAFGYVCGIVAKLQSIGLAVINETYRPPSR